MAVDGRDDLGRGQRRADKLQACRASPDRNHAVVTERHVHVLFEDHRARERQDQGAAKDRARARYDGRDEGVAIGVLYWEKNLIDLPSVQQRHHGGCAARRARRIRPGHTFTTNGGMPPHVASAQYASQKGSGVGVSASCTLNWLTALARRSGGSVSTRNRVATTL